MEMMGSIIEELLVPYNIFLKKPIQLIYSDIFDVET